jgi:hypothetical protein
MPLPSSVSIVACVPVTILNLVVVLAIFLSASFVLLSDLLLYFCAAWAGAILLTPVSSSFVLYGHLRTFAFLVLFVCYNFVTV